MTVLTILLLISSMQLISATPEGPPIDLYPQVCASMEPIGHNTTAQIVPCPFSFTVYSENCYSSDSTIYVKVADNSGENFFEGLFVQARKTPAEPMSYGTFGTNGDTQLKTLKCFNLTEENALSQAEAHHYFDKVFTWKPRMGLMDDIQFVATMVMHTDEYWMGLTSSVLKYNPNCLYDTTPPTADAIRVLPHAAVLLFCCYILRVFI